MSHQYTPDPRFPLLGPDFADPVTAATFPATVLRHRNQRWAAAVGLGDLPDAAFIAHFGRFEPLAANINPPLAMRYHGHQFRTYNPDIGDGRGFLFAQLRDDRGRLLDLATKGSGQTPYSRFGDGRLTLKGGVREVLAASMLETLGVYTSKAFSLIETGEALTRQDEPSPTRAAVLVRLGHSHIRFGTFQRHAYEESPERLRALVDHCVDHYAPALAPLEGPARVTGFLTHVRNESARLVASWMAAGFVHGVLNTDNMVITGESFDYGPWRFLPESNPSFVAAYFDQTGLYAFGRQPQAVGWNIAQLAASLLPIGDEAALIEVLEGYGAVYQQALRTAMLRRLGLCPAPTLEQDLTDLAALFAWMTETSAGWAQTLHDWFCGPASTARARQSPQAALYASPAFAAIEGGMFSRDPVRPERLDHPVFQRPSPPDLVIDTVEALWAKIATADDWSGFEQSLAEIEALRQALDLAPEAHVLLGV